jgi:hypothetical protein
MIAFTAGEESFDDINNNGQYDPSEFFEDLTEPFVDDNDNGTWDGDVGLDPNRGAERYVDVNGNGRWDGKNGVFDSNTLIWVQERILWTGFPHQRDKTGAEPVFRVVDPPGQVTITHFGSVAVTVVLTDPWFNTIAANGNDTCRGIAIEENPVVSLGPQEVAIGPASTYPSPYLLRFQIKDLHNPLNRPNQPADVPFANPVPFSLPVRCSWTSSPKGGASQSLDVTTFVGTVL